MDDTAISPAEIKPNMLLREMASTALSKNKPAENTTSKVSKNFTKKAEKLSPIKSAVVLIRNKMPISPAVASHTIVTKVSIFLSFALVIEFTPLTKLFYIIPHKKG